MQPLQHILENYFLKKIRNSNERTLYRIDIGIKEQ